MPYLSANPFNGSSSSTAAYPQGHQYVLSLKAVMGCILFTIVIVIKETSKIFLPQNWNILRASNGDFKIKYDWYWWIYNWSAHGVTHTSITLKNTLGCFGYHRGQVTCFSFLNLFIYVHKLHGQTLNTMVREMKPRNMRMLEYELISSIKMGDECQWSYNVHFI